MYPPIDQQLRNDSVRLAPEQTLRVLSGELQPDGRPRPPQMQAATRGGTSSASRVAPVATPTRK
jgi:hypothetical protein